MTLAAAGASVIGVARRADALDSLRSGIGDRAGAVVADIADRSNIDALAAEIATPFGAPDIVIHATGINTCVMAEAWSPQGITTNAIGPGFFPTELTQAVFDDPDRAARKASQTCLGRNSTMEDMDGPILFLCSDASSYVTGQVLMVDGGFTAK